MKRFQLALALLALTTAIVQAQNGCNTVSGTGWGHTWTERDSYVSYPDPGLATLEAEVLDVGGGQYEWQAPTRTFPRLTWSFRLQVRHPKKAWVTLLFRTYIQSTSPLALALKAEYPWLDPKAPVPAANLYPGWVGQPDIVVDEGLFWTFVFNGLMTQGVLTSEAVRDWYVPILDDGQPDEHHERLWDARPDAWTLNPSIPAQTMRAVWEGTLWDQSPMGNSQTISSEALARLAVMLQAPSLVEATCFLDSEAFHSAISEGLYVDVQAVSLISTDPFGGPPGLTDLGAPGLEGFPGFLPDGIFSNPITIAVAIAAPSTNGGGPGGGLPPNPIRGQNAYFFLNGAVNADLRFSGGPNLIQLHWAGSILQPMRFRAMIPLWAQNGALEMQNPYHVGFFTIGALNSLSSTMP
ncbi:MAG: hypothetical protein CMJ83_12300 [Planctomycetes bacterium]|nr:hypothetical protein [Planctomycetota bacterium]